MRTTALSRLNTLLAQLVQAPGDDEETLVLKKVWWIFVASCFLFPGIEVITAMFVGEYQVAIISGAIVMFCLVLLLVFHFHRKNIEAYGLAFQISIVAVTSLKTFLTGGLIYTAGVVYVGLIGPIQAVIFPNRRRALLVFLFYQVAIIASIFAQPYLDPKHIYPDSYFILTYITKFVFGTTFVFFSLDYFTNQLRKMKAEEARRLKAVDEMKTRFYTDIAHEFRTPLSIILGMADQVRREPDKWLNEGARLIRDNGRRLMDLTNQILDLSKLDAKAMPVSLIQEDIIAYIRYIAASFHALAEKKKIRLAVESEVEQLNMDFDPDKLQIILSNLLSNALRFTPEHGSIRISVALEGNVPKQHLSITVSDTGIGIPRHLLSRVFDRYFQVHQHNLEGKEGTGLGLALTQEMVKLLGGRIVAESTEDRGATFTVFLPFSRQAPNGHIRLNDLAPSIGDGLPPEYAPSGQSPTSKNPCKELSLLLVEDNPEFANYMKGLLQQEYCLEIANNGEQGLEKALLQVPDLIISDVMMPKMDGITMCNLLKNDIRTSHIPVILLTAKADMPSKVDGLNKGADAYLTKPFEREELFAQIRNLVAIRKKLQDYFQNFHNHPSVTEPQEPGIREAAFLRMVREIMESHLSDEDFGISELCRKLGMSRTQLYRKFQALTNTTAHRYFLDLRLRKAKELLESGDMNISEVALEVGFKNLSHFSKVFKQTFSVSPSEMKG